MRELWPFEKVVYDLWYCGFITEPMQVTTNVFCCTCTGVGWGAVCREAMEHLPGSMSISGNGTGAIWVNGRGGPHGVLIEIKELDRAKECREIGQAITGDDFGPVYSVGKVARLLLSFVGLPELDCKGNAPKSVERLLDGISYGFHACKPGEYEHLTMWDVSGYYFDLFSRFRSLRVTPDDDGIIDTPFKPEERDRWKDVLAGVAECKHLRNTIAGVAAGSTRWLPMWTHDKKTGRVVRKYKPPRPGPFRGAGLLVVHTGTVLCRKEHLTTRSVYSTIDCVTLPEGEPCEWPRHGFHVSIKADRTGAKASGKAVICNRGSYQIGAVRTKPFIAGITEQVGQDGCGEPPIDYSRYLLEG